MAGVPPQQALYVHNLNDKLQKEELKRALYLLFCQFGPLMDVVALKTQRMRGQAFVVFQDVSAATTAMRQLQGLPFFEKPLKIQYGKTKSDAVARLDGTYSAKKRRERKVKEREKDKEKDRLTNKRKEGREAIQDKDAKRRKTEEEAQEQQKRREAERKQLQEDAEATPHRVLFVEGLPDEAVSNPQMLAALFQNFDGFAEVRLPPGKVPVAFVDFATPEQAKEARLSLQGFKVTYEHSLRISYAKR